MYECYTNHIYFQWLCSRKGIEQVQAKEIEKTQRKDIKKVEVRKQVGKYTMPDEKSKHEGTWLQWPHEFTYGQKYQQEVEPIWIQMTNALSKGEKSSYCCI